MKDTVNLVPQVFYDLIGRVVPGAGIIVAAFWLLATDRVGAARRVVEAKPELASVTILCALCLLTSYLIGTLLGGIGFALFEDERSDRNLINLARNAWAAIGFSQTDDVQRSRNLSAMKVDRPTTAEAHILKSQLPYVYDYILLRNASAGGRLAKLRAEVHMCRVLMLGCVSLAIAYVGRGLLVQGVSVLGGPEFWLTLTALLVVGRASYLLDVHLVVRARLLLGNCWTILKQHEETEAAPKKLIHRPPLRSRG